MKRTREKPHHKKKKSGDWSRAQQVYAGRHPRRLRRSTAPVETIESIEAKIRSAESGRQIKSASDLGDPFTFALTAIALVDAKKRNRRPASNG